MEPEPVDNPDVQHETSDVNIGGVFAFGGGLLGAALMIYFVVWLLFGFLGSRPTPGDAEQYPLAAGQSRLPPEPRLQVTPRQDLQDLRAQEDKTLTSYQWVDRNGGVVRIPIDQAKKLMLQRGLPARQETGPAK